MIDKLKRYREERNATGDVMSLLSGDISAADEQRIMEQNKAGSDYQQSFVETIEVLGDVETLASDKAFMALLEPGGKENTNQLTTTSRNWSKLAIAAFLVISFVVGYHLQNNNPTAESNVLRYVTRVGEQKKIDLPDGSRITLNTTTQLLVDYSESARRIMLERGEAYFDVVKDPNRLFTVDLGGRAVSVLGTEFSILRQPEKFTLAVSEGMVALHRRDDVVVPAAPLITPQGKEKFKLTADVQRRVQAGTVVEFNIDRQEFSAYQDSNLDRLHSWRKGVIHFISAPLYQVVQELNRYSARKILIEDDSIMNLSLYATVNIKHLNEALLVIEQALPIKIIQRFDRIVIIGK